MIKAHFLKCGPIQITPRITVLFEGDTRLTDRKQFTQDGDLFLVNEPVVVQVSRKEDVFQVALLLLKHLFVCA